MATPQTRAPTIIASQPQSQVVSQQHQQHQHQQHQIANTNTLLQLQQHQLQKKLLSATNATPTVAFNLCSPIGNQSFSNNAPHSNNFKITNGDSIVDNQNHPNSIGGKFKVYSELTNQLVVINTNN